MGTKDTTTELNDKTQLKSEQHDDMSTIKTEIEENQSKAIEDDKKPETGADLTVKEEGNTDEVKDPEAIFIIDHEKEYDIEDIFSDEDESSEDGQPDVLEIDSDSSE